jgi:hypothetical protein
MTDEETQLARAAETATDDDEPDDDTDIFGQQKEAA